MGTVSPYLVYIVFFRAIAPARAVAPQKFFGVSLRVQQLYAVRQSTEAGPSHKIYMLGLGVRTFCHCLAFLSSLVYVCQSQTGWNTRNGNFMITVCKRGGRSMSRRSVRDRTCRQGMGTSSSLTAQPDDAPNTQGTRGLRESRRTEHSCTNAF
jgi:hypothetical protein